VALLVSDLIADAFSFAYPFVPEYATARGPLLRKLSQLDDKVVGEIALNAPGRLATIASDITVVFATNPTGYTLQAGATAYLNFKYKYPDGRITPLTVFGDMIPDTTQAPAAALRGATLYPLDPNKSRWISPGQYFIGNGDKIGYDYVPGTVPVTLLTQTLISPDDARQYIVSELTLQVLLAGGIAPQLRIQAAVGDKNDMWQGLVSWMKGRADMQSSYGLPRGTF
jgi:hypothetical protein